VGRCHSVLAAVSTAARMISASWSSPSTTRAGYQGIEVDSKKKQFDRIIVSATDSPHTGPSVGDLE
jgi:hypothetical protein